MQTTPVFKDATPREVRTMRFWIGSNIAVILFCASWLIYHFTVAGLSLPYLMAASLAGYFLADFSSGAVHWAMDTWFDERTMGRAIAITREHHTRSRPCLWLSGKCLVRLGAERGGLRPCRDRHRIVSGLDRDLDD